MINPKEAHDKLEALERRIRQLESSQQEMQEMIDALTPIAEEIRLKIGNENYLNDESINPDSHAGQISLTVKEARKLLTALCNAGAITENQ